MRRKYASLREDLQEAIANPSRNTNSLKRKIIANGLHEDLGLDSLSAGIYSVEELKKTDSFVEELANEKITGAYYVMGEPYSAQEMAASVLAGCADKIAYTTAKWILNVARSQKIIYRISILSPVTICPRQKGKY